VDGFKRKLNASLQFKLSAWLCVAIVAIAMAGGALSFATAFEEANEMQDDQLRQVAALFKNNMAHLTLEERRNNAPDTNVEFRILVEILTPSGIEVLSVRQPALEVSQNVVDGLQTVLIQNEAWRIFTSTLADDRRLVVAQKIAIRDEVAGESATATLIPYIILIPVLLLIIAYLVREMFRPVTQLAQDLDQRSEQDLYEINQTNLPAEILPFVAAINRMLLRVDQSVASQRRFVADAAHEMRTPLTALSLQVERLEAAEMSGQARQRLSTLKDGLERTRLLLNQLLAFARAQQINNDEKPDVSVQHAIRRVLEDMMPLAEAKHIDLGVVSELDARLLVQEFDLVSLIKNLVDNAIRYTPDGGKIDLSLTQNQEKLILRIIDNGCGIPEAERDRVFDPFYRVLGNDETGSGLGLSIVKAIAVRIGAEIELSSVKENTGLCVSVAFRQT
jgi:two-component system, OmpR family, sensor kinase